MIGAIIVLSVIVGSLIAGAIGDGLNDRPNKVVKEGDEIKKVISYKPTGHILKGAEIGLLLLSPFLISVDILDLIPYVASYMLARAVLFNPLYNVARGVNINHIGNSNMWDRFLRKMKAPNWGFWFARVILLAAALGIILNEF